MAKGTKVNMLGDRVLLKVDEAKSMTDTGMLHLPEQSKDQPQTATVIAVGPGKFTVNGFFIQPVCAPGDRVIFPKYAGISVEIDGESYIIAHDDEISCKTREEGDEA